MERKRFFCKEIRTHHQQQTAQAPDNFHPDFILWLLADGQQRVIFVDPKGIRNLGPHDPKIQFYKTIKEIEQRLGDPLVLCLLFIHPGAPNLISLRSVGTMPA